MSTVYSPALCVENNIYTPQPILASANIYHPSYLHYYNIDSIGLNMAFIPLNKNAEKRLNKFQKKEYKKITKIEKYLSRNDFYRAYNIDSTYLPTLIQSFYYNESKKNYKNAIIFLEKIKQYDRTHILNSAVINLKLGEMYFFDKDYQNAINYILPNINELLTNKDINIEYYRCIVADSYLELGNYNNAIDQANKIKKENLDNYKMALIIKFDAYSKLNEKIKANKIAYELYSYSCPSKYNAAINIAETTNDTEVKLKFYDIAKINTTDEKEVLFVNFLIAKALQKKLENICNKSIQGFFKTPNWFDIVKKDSNIMTITQSNERFDDYYKEVNNCTSKYTSNNLKNCLNNIIEEQEKISHRLLIEQQERNRQIAEQQRLRELRIQNALQLQQNNLLQQQNYYLNRPRYYNSTTTQYGNTYYTNTYSY